MENTSFDICSYVRHELFHKAMDVKKKNKNRRRRSSGAADPQSSGLDNSHQNKNKSILLCKML